MYETKNILITGASGTIGKKIIPELVDKGYNLYCLVRDPSKLGSLADKLSVIKGDLRQKGFLKNLSQMDCIIHIAAETPGNNLDLSTEKERRYHEVNVEGTKYLVNEAQRLGVSRFIYISTHAIVDYDKEQQHKDAYVKSKLMAEKIVMKDFYNWTIIRPSGIYSDSAYWHELIKKFKSQKRIKLIGGEMLRQFIYSKDVASSILQCLENEQTYNKIYNIAGASSFTLKDYYKTIRKLSKSNFKIISIPLWPYKVSYNLLAVFSKKYSERTSRFRLQNKDFVTDIRPAQKDFGFKPHTLHEGLSDLFNKILA